MVVDALRTGLHAAAPMRPANSHVKSPCDTVQSTVSVTTLVNGYIYSLSGQGHVRPLGLTNLMGDLNAVGSISEGRAGGTVTLSDSEGTLTLDLTGPLQSSFSPLPNKFDYSITGGTGCFGNATGQGAASLELVPAITSNPLEQQGRFDLRLVGTP